METLFPIGPVMPYGFSYYPDFITKEQEQKLLEMISGMDLHTLIFQGYEAKRKVESFGYSYHFDTRTITKGKPIPEQMIFLVRKVEQWFSLPEGSVAQVLVTEYPIGAVINWHRDAPPFDKIIGLSLQSDCTFKQRPYDKAKQGRKSVISQTVKRRSLYIMQEEAREDWEHSTAPVQEIRFSITMRTLRPGFG
ncbi:alpha-ketoglutarate-dependent dioxygenase AlkB [Pedobacter sp. UBA4863]|uniref:alpha-ketoglutarate-dependent dioxygenase AlkB n=1 Tax=Pedobacter sp. UBA4863 TaxID=1947060 RepID=UPI0025E1C1BF|nr:alpha-ketoglutarate-dependent dioxygenase AlkB [Pedobacter sp. UBA4863]